MHDEEVWREVLATGKLCVLLCSGRGWTGFPFDRAPFRFADFVSGCGFSLLGSRQQRPIDARGEKVCGYKLEVPVDVLVELFAWATCSFSDSGGSMGSILSRSSAS